MATGQRGGGRSVSWTVPLRYWEARLLDATFEVLRVRARQRVSRAQWLLTRAQVLLRAATQDDTLPPTTRTRAAQALTDYERQHELAKQAVVERQHAPAWDALAR